jgi:hypothetical protein
MKLAYDNVLFWRFGHVLIVISIFIFLEQLLTFPPLLLKIGSETLTIYATHYVVLYGTWLGIGIKTFGQYSWSPIPVVIGAVSFVLAAMVYIQNIEKIREKVFFVISARTGNIRRYFLVKRKRFLRQLKSRFNQFSTNMGLW